MISALRAFPSPVGMLFYGRALALICGVLFLRDLNLEQSLARTEAAQALAGQHLIEREGSQAAKEVAAKEQVAIKQAAFAEQKFWNNTAVKYIFADQYEEAIPLLEKCRDKYPEYRYARQNLSIAYWNFALAQYNKGEYVACLQTLEGLRVILPELEHVDPDMQYSKLHQLALKAACK